jgi:hypothetical protein
MTIALDYDFTYTADRQLWDKFIADAKNCGHRVCCVTHRRPENAITDLTSVEIIYTSYRAKRRHCESLGLRVNVWIDDSPESVEQDDTARMNHA